MSEVEINNLKKEINDLELYIKKRELKYVRQEKVISNLIIAVNNHQNVIGIILEKLEMSLEDDEMGGDYEEEPCILQ